MSTSWSSKLILTQNWLARDIYTYKGELPSLAKKVIPSLYSISECQAIKILACATVAMYYREWIPQHITITVMHAFSPQHLVNIIVA